MKNKRGDIPVTILVIGIFAVCTLAILSFLHSSFLLNKSFVGIDFMEEANINIEKNSLPVYYIEKNITIFKPKLSLNWAEEKTVFSVQYISNP